MATRVSIQGYEGSFHQEAARIYYGNDVQVVCCANFKEVIKAAQNKREASGGVMAIENSIAGSILPNYSLLQSSKLCVAGEVYLQINQNLLVNPNVALGDIREVHSHYMALLQCQAYLDKQNWKLVETEDTALSAKHIHQHKSKHIAAIASQLAAELYSLNIIAPHIHTLKNNYTRFLVLQREEDGQIIADANKASVNFHTNHSKGSLSKVLTAIAEEDINLSKLQSFPIPGSDFKYSFHADLEFDDISRFHNAMEAVRSLTEETRVYGIYKSGKAAPDL